MLSICVYADTNQRKPIGIVVPVESAVRGLAVKLGVPVDNRSYESLLEDFQVRQEIHLEMLSVAKSHGLVGVELIQGVVLVAEEWTPDNVSPHLQNSANLFQLMLTAARKLNRRNIFARFEEQINVLPF